MLPRRGGRRLHIQESIKYFPEIGTSIFFTETRGFPGKIIYTTLKVFMVYIKKCEYCGWKFATDKLSDKYCEKECKVKDKYNKNLDVVRYVLKD